jgi:hypothetical protein
MEALRAYQQVPRPIERARVGEDAASALSGIGRREEAAALLGEAVGIYERVGAFMDLTRAEAALRGLGIRRGRRGARRRPSRGWESLTPTEIGVTARCGMAQANAQDGQERPVGDGDPGAPEGYPARGRAQRRRSPSAPRSGSRSGRRRR